MAQIIVFIAIFLLLLLFLPCRFHMHMNQEVFRLRFYFLPIFRKKKQRWREMIERSIETFFQKPTVIGPSYGQLLHALHIEEVRIQIKRKTKDYLTMFQEQAIVKAAVKILTPYVQNKAGKVRISYQNAEHNDLEIDATVTIFLYHLLVQYISIRRSYVKATHS